MNKRELYKIWEKLDSAIENLKGLEKVLDLIAGTKYARGTIKAIIDRDLSEAMDTVEYLQSLV